MSKMKDYLLNILESLEKSGMDYEYVANLYEMTPAEVYEIAKTYGDVE